jgi:hypothetical protein
VKEITAKYLSKRYLEFFRDDEKMSLKAFSKIVQRELKMCPSRHKLGRARHMALKEIHGDENDQFNQHGIWTIKTYKSRKHLLHNCES